MVAKAFVLIETAVGKTREVCSGLQRLDVVKSVDAVTGPYDVIITIEGEDINTIGKLITNKIHVISGIIRTVTCLTIRIN